MVVVDAITMRVRCLVVAVASLATLVAATASTEEHVCLDVDDCPEAPACHDVECVVPLHVSNSEHAYAGECVYTRRNISECCLTSDECCEYAAPHQVGICDKNCTCQFVSSLQCRVDADCDGLVSSLACRAQGECFVPHCDAGLCRCFNGTGIDLDGDGVPCPDDCNDQDPTISASIKCLLDYDNDYYPSCAGGEGSCMDFCVEVNHTCPYGYTDPTDPDHNEWPRSQRPDTGVPCEEQPVFDEGLCDCCDIDKRAHPGSLYSASTPNNCQDADYDCDNTTEYVGCCADGMLDAYGHHHAAGRYIWFSQLCVDDFVYGDCGGCSTVNETAVRVGGFACETNCSDGEFITTVPEGACPNVCANECACADAQTQPPLGQCAKFVTSCVEVRPDLFADHEACCAIAVH